MNDQTPEQPSTRSRLTSNVLGIGIAVAIVVLLTAALNFRVALSASPDPKAPLTVDTVQFKTGTNYDRTATYLGLVVAGRKADLAFQIPGIIAAAPLREGTRVQRGQAIAALDETAVALKRKATAADLQQAKVELELAGLRAARQKQLLASGSVSKEMYDETRLGALALASRVDAVAARLASIDDEIEKSTLLAPYEGVVANRYVQLGAVVTPSTPVVRLLETVDQEAHIGVPAERVGNLVPGNQYSLKLRDTVFPAELLSIRPDVDPVTRTAIAVFALPGATEALDGEPITLQLQESIAESGGWLPMSALLEGSRGLWTVLTVKEDADTTRTVKEAVEVLYINGEEAYVRGTLTTGATVVASGVHRISPGSRVSVRGQN